MDEKQKKALMAMGATQKHIERIEAMKLSPDLFIKLFKKLLPILLDFLASSSGGGE